MYGQIKNKNHKCHQNTTSTHQYNPASVTPLVVPPITILVCTGIKFNNKWVEGKCIFFVFAIDCNTCIMVFVLIIFSNFHSKVIHNNNVDVSFNTPEHCHKSIAYTSSVLICSITHFEYSFWSYFLVLFWLVLLFILLLIYVLNFENSIKLQLVPLKGQYSCEYVTLVTLENCVAFQYICKSVNLYICSSPLI